MEWNENNKLIINVLRESVKLSETRSEIEVEKKRLEEFTKKIDESFERIVLVGTTVLNINEDDTQKESGNKVDHNTENYVCFTCYKHNLQETIVTFSNAMSSFAETAENLCEAINVADMAGEFPEVSEMSEGEYLVSIECDKALEQTIGAVGEAYRRLCQMISELEFITGTVKFKDVFVEENEINPIRSSLNSAYDYMIKASKAGVDATVGLKALSSDNETEYGNDLSQKAKGFKTLSKSIKQAIELMEEIEGIQSNLVSTVL